MQLGNSIEKWQDLTCLSHRECLKLKNSKLSQLKDFSLSTPARRHFHASAYTSYGPISGSLVHVDHEIVLKLAVLQIRSRAEKAFQLISPELYNPEYSVVGTSHSKNSFCA
jgi:hypothetical protein